jgi:hypothetical protein
MQATRVLVVRVSCLVAVSAAGCSLYSSPPTQTTAIPDAPIPCLFGPTTDTQYCTTPGASCSVGDLCYCGCTSQGWWSCNPVPGECPLPPGDPAPVDAAPDAPACGIIQAGGLGPYAGWQTDLDSGGYALATDQAGAAFTFEFVGTSLVIYVEDGPSFGSYGVSVDQAPTAVIDATTATVTHDNPTVVASDLAYGPHSATVTCRATDCQVDFFVAGCP